MKNAKSFEKCYTVKEVAEILNVCTRTIYRQISNGKMKTMVVGGQYRIPDTAFENLYGTKAKSCSREWDTFLKSNQMDC